MSLTGHNLIAGELRPGTGAPNRAMNPACGTLLEPVFGHVPGRGVAG